MLEGAAWRGGGILRSRVDSCLPPLVEVEMVVAAGGSLLDQSATLKDPRRGWKVVYPLPEVLLVVLCGPLAGAEDFVEIRRWGLLHLIVSLGVV